MFDQQLSNVVEYQCQANINIYDSSECNILVTQAAIGRNLQVIQLQEKFDSAILVKLQEDDYQGWLRYTDIDKIQPTQTPFQPHIFGETEIREKLPEVIAFTYKAMNTSNYYLWGGTVGPNYDCSGLIQAAFVSVGIWLPRDAYQQEAFCQKISLDKYQLNNQLIVGDLVFFGTGEKADHVGLYLGEGRYIHSSGKSQGRNGIGIDVLSEVGDEVSQRYYQLFRSAARVVRSYGNTK
ncbi:MULTISPECIES: C40 family peptidase [Okeania]|uniref:NlpC/P60 family protein n=1 Tax=Okeania hirsuta TaxID=1458930 RepID=A0A3N6PP65_9CYAN|nr:MULTISPECIES: C40 family peptidase [Okeania]NEP05043.1 C40 family peptidase [Okeania sp. SIO4D6]NEP40765.1 C40 family peptidase [Okeania sp. SIO2H7]NET12635.1 C40 family peptidase [Okeania sp. SIO1H6]NEP73822.1 C40 family peptidase [Okeania sp. SIO2G5]NEP95225.1 C40 family peptidase [Okeania sp. SIO2F5]